MQMHARKPTHVHVHTHMRTHTGQPAEGLVDTQMAQCCAHGYSSRPRPWIRRGAAVSLWLPLVVLLDGMHPHCTRDTFLSRARPRAPQTGWRLALRSAVPAQREVQTPSFQASEKHICVLYDSTPWRDFVCMQAFNIWKHLYHVKA